MKLPDLKDYKPWGGWEKKMLKDLKKAMKDQDVEALKFYTQFGSTTRQILMNSHTYLKRKKYGFRGKKLGEYGWIIREPWKIEEEVVVYDFNKYHLKNVVSLAMGPNGKWTHGMMVNSALGCGHTGGPNEFLDPCDAREEALKQGLRRMKEWLQEQSRRNDQHEDGVNFNKSIVNNTLKNIEKVVLSLNQLSLFD